MKKLLAAAALFLVVGCASPAMRTHDVASDAGGPRGVERTVEVPAEERGWGAPTIRLSSPIEEGSTLRIGAPPAPGPSRPATHGLIDVDLKAAALGDALRFIADAGGFNLVVEGEPLTPITVKLRRVEAFDALLTVAEAHGLDVRFERGIVVVGTPKSHATMGLAKSDIQ